MRIIHSKPLVSGQLGATDHIVPTMPPWERILSAVQVEERIAHLFDDAGFRVLHECETFLSHAVLQTGKITFIDQRIDDSIRFSPLDEWCCAYFSYNPAEFSVGAR